MSVQLVCGLSCPHRTDGSLSRRATPGLLRGSLKYSQKLTGGSFKDS